jgi:hypothetical protein
MGDMMEVKIGNYMVKAETSVKLLGIHIDNNLCFNGHISYLCQKAGFKLNASARMSKKVDFNGKLMLFNSFILSCFMYCPVVWHFCGIADMKKIEKIQKRVLRYITNDYQASYSELLEKCSLPTMYVQRIRSLMIELFGK